MKALYVVIILVVHLLPVKPLIVVVLLIVAIVWILVATRNFVETANQNVLKAVVRVLIVVTIPALSNPFVLKGVVKRKTAVIILALNTNV